MTDPAALRPSPPAAREPGQVRECKGRKIVSYGTSSYGYDMRLADDGFRIFSSVHAKEIAALASEYALDDLRALELPLHEHDRRVVRLGGPDLGGGRGERGVADGALHEAAARVYINDAAGRIDQSAKTALAAMAASMAFPPASRIRVPACAFLDVITRSPAQPVTFAHPTGGAGQRANGFYRWSRFRPGRLHDLGLRPILDRRLCRIPRMSRQGSASHLADISLLVKSRDERW